MGSRYTQCLLKAFTLSTLVGFRRAAEFPQPSTLFDTLYNIGWRSRMRRKSYGLLTVAAILSFR